MNNSFGLNVKKYRKLAKLTQTDLALKVGYKGKGSINRIEYGMDDTPLSKVILIAQALGVSVYDLISEEPNALAEYAPYLNNASESTLESVRKLLDMPKKVEKDSVCSTKVS